MKKYVITEVSQELIDASLYFDDDGITPESGDYCNTIFIVENRRISGFNVEELDKIANEIETLYNYYADIEYNAKYADYTSVGAMLFDLGYIRSKHDGKSIKAYSDFLQDADDNYKPEILAAFLTIKTGKTWRTHKARGYGQGDSVDMIFCPDNYPEGVRAYGDMWLGCFKEFTVTELDEQGEEINSCGGFVIADSDVKTDADYKTIVCEQYGIDPAESSLMMISGSCTKTVYRYEEITA